MGNGAAPPTSSPTMEEMIQQIMAMVQATIAKRDRGDTLLPMERILLAATQNAPDKIPTGTLFTDCTAIHYGLSPRQLERNPKLHAETIMRWYADFDAEFIVEGIDTMNSEIEAMGLVTMKLPENAPGDIKERALDRYNDEDALKFYEAATERFDPAHDGRLPRRVELYQRLVELSHARGYPVIAGPSAHFAQCVNALGYKRVISWIRRAPENFHRAMAYQTKANVKWWQLLAGLGVDGIIAIDAWNAMPNFRKEYLLEFEKPYVAKAIQAVAPLPVIHFGWGLRACGDPGWIEFLEACAATGSFTITNLDPDASTPPSNDLKRFKDTALRLGKSYIVGMKDEYMSSKRPEDIKQWILRVIDELYPCDGGCFLVPNMFPAHSPGENMTAWCSYLKEYGTYPIDIERVRRDRNN